MKYLDKLLQGRQVQWKTLGEVAKIKNGKDWKNYKEGEVPVYGSGGIMTFIDISVFDKPSVLIPRKGSLGNLFYVDVPFWTVDTIFWTDIDINLVIPKYLFYYLQTQELEKLNMAGGVPSLTQTILNKLQIPIPPMDVQQEIVRILDKFTELTTELTTELKARKKQYAYYREELLTTKNTKEVEWKTLGEMAIYSKKRINFSSVNEDNYVGVENLLQDRAGKSKSNYVPTSGNLTCFNIGDILIGNIRPYLKKIWFADCKGGTNGDVLVIHLIDKAINARYLYQILADDSFFSYNMQHAKGAKMPRGNKEKIMDFKIPIPPLAEQERIVSILDKFDTLTNSISEGLPREIELRQKQYEYYRNELLSF